jgi:hypothetical protein
MAYIRIGEDESKLGSFGCGPGCRCSGCRRTGGRSGLDELYVPEEPEEEEAEPPPPPPPQRPPQHVVPPAANLSGWGRFGEPPPGRRLRMPAFTTITGFTHGGSSLSAAQLEGVTRAAEFIARSWPGASPVTSVRITGYIDADESQSDLGQQRAVAVRDALVQTLGSIRPGLATRLRWITEDRGLSAVSKVEIYLWVGPTPMPVPPLVRIPSPAEVTRRAQPAMLRPRRPARSNPFRPLPGAMEGFGQPVSPAPSGPVFDVQCPNPPGCPPIAAGQCRAVLRQAIIEAIKLANNAASKVEAATNVEPAKRDPAAKKTAHLFKFFFGHDPTRPVPWAGNAASGVSVAFRFRAVAKELAGGRRIVFRCLPTRADCADADLTCCSTNTHAWVNQNNVPNVVHLCARFWNPPPGLRGLPALQYRAAIIIHEMLHLLFQDFLLHAPPGRPDAHCYEAFALRLADFGADPSDVRQCRPPAQP